MTVRVFGHYGTAFLFFPTDGEDVDELCQTGVIDSMAEFIESGRCRVYCSGGVDSESWLCESASSEEKSRRHLEYNNYIVEELYPFIYENCGMPVPIMTCGAGIGAFHAANTYFRRPDVFHGTIALSGFYDINELTKGYFDDNCYFNSPAHYLPNLNDNYWLTLLVSKKNVFIATGSGEGERPWESIRLSEILTSKGAPHKLDVWGEEWGRSVETWKAMLKKIVGENF